MRCLFALVLVLVITSSQSQPCILLASDDFNYPPNQPLHGQQGGTGWAEPWNVQVFNTVLPGYQTANGSLVYGALRTSGGQANGGREYLTAGRRLDTDPEGPFAEYILPNSDAIGTRKGSTLWMSAVLRKTQNNSQSVFAGVHSEALSWCNDCTQRRIEFGYFEGHSDVGGQRRWTLRIGNQYYPTSVPVAVGSAAFFVLKMTFLDPYTAVELFVNPTMLGTAGPPLTPTITQNTADPFLLRSVHLYLGHSPGNGAADEIRLAKTYACVAPDNTVTLDLPPVAVITATPTDGIAPLTVSLSAAGSYDPEGLPLVSYQWNFGDGSAPATGVNHVHTYTALGQLPVRLTVRDVSGQQHTVTRIITVRRPDNTFPCLSSFTLVRPASCSNNDGILRIHPGTASYTLRDANGKVLTPVNVNEFHHLPAGTYRYEATSAAGCADRFTLHVPVDSTTCAGWQPSTCRMIMGTNLSGFADWVPERPLRNRMKHVRPNIVAYDDACYCWSNGNEALIARTPDGYPTHVPQLANGVPNKVRYVVSTEGANLPPGSYVLLYDGQGVVTVSGNATAVSNTPGRLQFQVTGTDIVVLNIEASQAGNPVRNFRLLRLQDEFVDLAENPFYEVFLEKIAPFQVLRFMDWGATNNNPVRRWQERTPLTYFTYGTPQGVPYEVMIDLANRTRKDVWICVPHAVDDDYITRMAELFRDRLDSNRTIYLEYSNEVWNWIFDQAHYNEQTRPANLNYGRAIAEKAGRVFRIWHQVFGPQKHRVKRVLGLQAGYNYLNEEILAQLSQSEWDYGSPASYIGLDHTSNGKPVLHAGSTIDDILTNARNHWAEFRPVVRQDYWNVQLFGKEVLNYEGGQHFVGNVFGIPYPYQQAMWAAQYSPGIYALYNDMLDTIRAWGSRLFGNFTLASPQESVYGSWGVLNDIDIQPPYMQTAPKYQALLDNRCAMPTKVNPELKRGEDALVVFPNPTSGTFSIQLHLTHSDTLQLRVYDALGRLIAEGVHTLPAGEHRLPVHLSSTPAGLYRVFVFGENGSSRSATLQIH
ncbi:MAG: PKD domain-containing protein [Saprospiraceae bacterium]|nr:PKD domain-containing protein [Saprospiraceae bacterium]MDW8483137.1 PKD domain-containing protein [Saprospiraceae bacterium]